MSFIASERRPGAETAWRAVTLFGANTASYKFALGTTLLDLASRGVDFVTLDDLALPYAQHVAEHLRQADKQTTSRSSRFLDACRAFNRGDLTLDQLRDATVRLGFQHVIDAFHVVNQGQMPTRFYVDERRSRRGLTLTDDLLRLAEGEQFANLSTEVEARWRLVETAWALVLPASLLEVRTDADGALLYAVNQQARRVDITGSRGALNGYQKGRCFYCVGPITVEGGTPGLADVDHFIPRVLGPGDRALNLDGVWNLVLACPTCNRGAGGKHARLPAQKYLQRLHQRNEWLIDSHHPLRETILRQTGATTAERVRYLSSSYDHAHALLVHTWSPSTEHAASLGEEAEA